MSILSVQAKSLVVRSLFSEKAGTVWGGRSCDEIRLVLQQRDHKVTAIDLPGTRVNERAVAQVTMDKQTVADVIKEQGHKVTLVGHSLAGNVISQVAGFMPEKIERLIYVAGFLYCPGSGKRFDYRRPIRHHFWR